MHTIDADDVSAELTRLLADVRAGQTIVITQHGTPVAQLVPPTDGPRPDVAAAIKAIREFRARENISLGGLSIKELIEEGRM